ncbi:MAG TPA: protein YgfX [Dyella sp.]|uniref:protein YgfX n=1 Tax=Dyella sp. TaxID=1869338 RepID=UPI002BA7E05B|nr:protein YgfX [Dyella sp.]HUB88133.1 protein YgfX [Dyella sp.]
MTSAPAIGFEYRPSRWVPRLFAGITGLAMLAIVLSGLPLFACMVLCTASAAACRYAVGRLSLPIYAVGWASQSGWTLRGLDGGDEVANLLSFRIIRQLVLLRLASGRYGKLTLWLMPDNLDADTRRRLRMRLAVMREAAEEPA